MFNIVRAMGRRKDHTRDELRALAIDAGYALVCKGGVAELTARKVAAAIGYAPGTLYNLFADFDELIVHVNARVLDDLKQFLGERLDRCKGRGTARMKALATAYIEFGVERRSLWSSLYEHIPAMGFKIPDWYLDKVNEVFVIVESVLKNQVHGGKKRARVAARTLWAAIHGIALLSLTSKLDVARAGDAKKLCDSLIENYLKGLNAR